MLRSSLYSSPALRFDPGWYRRVSVARALGRLSLACNLILTPVFCSWASFLATERDTTVYLIFSLAACYCTNVVTVQPVGDSY